MSYPIPIGRDNRAAEIERETAERRRRQARARITQQYEQIDREDDPDLLEQLDAAWADVLWDANHERRRAAGRQPR